MMPAIEDMVTREAMPASEAMRVNRGASHRSSNAALCAARGAISIFDSLPNGIHGIMRGVLYHATSPYKTTGRSSGKAPARLTTESAKETAMAKLVIPHYRTDSQICESPVPTKTNQFTLEALPFDRFRITDSHGNSAECDLEDMFTQLRHIRSQARVLFAPNELEILCNEADWYFPTRLHGCRSSSCVYFFSAAYAPGLIKIGFTSNLRSRINHLSWLDGTKHASTLHAYADLSRNRRLEDSLHKHFADHRNSGEWFAAEPVLTWLDGMKAQVAS